MPALISDPHVPSIAWVPIDLAAQTLGVTEQALRLKAPALIRKGQARKLSSQVGGQTKWHFATIMDPRLALLRSTPADPAAPDAAADPLDEFRALPKHKQAAATARAAAVRMFRAWRASGGNTASAAMVAALLARVSDECGVECKALRRLYDWNDIAADADTSTSFGFQLAAARLIDRRGLNRAGETTYSDAAWSLFEAMYLRDNALSVYQCWSAVRDEAQRHGWSWVSLSRAKQLVHERIPAGRRTLAREGEEAWQRRHLPPIVQDENAWAAGQCWETDHSRCDFFVRVVKGGQWVAVRPWLTAFLDRRSRRLMGWALNFEANSDGIRAALHHALSQDDASVPEVIVLDNGKDFASQEFSGLTKAQRRAGQNDSGWSGLFGLLGITPHFATPYNHNAKARIERFFGVAHRDHDRRLDSWCGSDKEPRAQEAIDRVLSEPEKLPTLTEARASFDAWATRYNAGAERNVDALIDVAGERRSPADWYAANLPSFRALPNKRDVLTMLEHRWSRPVTPSKFGVPLRLDGKVFTYGQYEPAIADLVGSGRKVHVTYNPADMSSVRVYDERFALLCVAPLNEKHGGIQTGALEKSDLKIALARQRTFRRQQRQAVDLAAAVLTPAELAAVVRREREVDETRANLKAAGTPTTSDAPVRLVRTPFTDFDQDDTSEPLRMAAGAENLNFPPAFPTTLNAPSTPGEDAFAGDEGGDLGPISLLDAIDSEPTDRSASDLAGIDILRELGA